MAKKNLWTSKYWRDQAEEARTKAADMKDADAALPYFIRTIQGTPPDDPLSGRLSAHLRATGRPDLAMKVEQAGKARFIRTP